MHHFENMRILQIAIWTGRLLGSSGEFSYCLNFWDLQKLLNMKYKENVIIWTWALINGLAATNKCNKHTNRFSWSRWHLGVNDEMENARTCILLVRNSEAALFCDTRMNLRCCTLHILCNWRSSNLSGTLLVILRAVETSVRNSSRCKNRLAKLYVLKIVVVHRTHGSAFGTKRNVTSLFFYYTAIQNLSYVALTFDTSCCSESRPFT